MSSSKRSSGACTRRSTCRTSDPGDTQERGDIAVDAAAAPAQRYTFGSEDGLIVHVCVPADLDRVDATGFPPRAHRQSLDPSVITAPGRAPTGHVPTPSTPLVRYRLPVNS